ncbi:MAG: Arm DNA-binding domain-containing protein, partial [Ginsengibacter sp.]
MGEVNFYLKKPNAKKGDAGKQLILLYKFYKGKRCVISTGQSVDPKNWNPKKQRLKSNSITISDGSESLNDFLDQLEKRCNKSFTDALAIGVPSPQALRESLQGYINRVEDHKEGSDSLFKLIDRFIAGEIKSKGKDKSRNTLQNYNTVKGHLIEYQLKTKTK